MFRQKIETITPQTALKFLDGMTNRPVRKTKVKKYADDITANNWKFTGEAIKFDNSGNLIDGQHRLLACISAGKSFKTLVQRGLPTEIFHFLDTGTVRSGSDILSIEGHANSKVLAAAAKMVAAYRIDKTFNAHKSLRLSNIELSNLVENEDGLTDSVHFICGRKHINGTSKGTMAALHYLCSLKSPLDADNFFAKLYEGSDLEKGNPILVLRNKLMNFSIQNYRERQMFVEMVIRAWNHWRNRNHISTINVNGNVPEIQ